MLEIIARLLLALAVATGAQGVGTASDHASPDGNANGIAAIEAIIAQVSAALEQVPRSQRHSNRLKPQGRPTRPASIERPTWPTSMLPTVSRRPPMPRPVTQVAQQLPLPMSTLHPWTPRRSPCRSPAGRPQPSRPFPLLPFQRAPVDAPGQGNRP